MLHSTELVFHYQRLTVAAHLKVTFVLFPPLCLLIPPWLPVWMPQGNRIKDWNTSCATSTRSSLLNSEVQPGFIPKYTADIHTGAVEGERMLLCHCVCDVRVWSEIKRLQGAPAASARYYIILSEDEYEKVKRWVVKQKQSVEIKGGIKGRRRRGWNWRTANGADNSV